MKKIVGEAKVKKVLKGPPESVWEFTKEWSGINKEFYDSYYKDRFIAIAFEIYDVKRYNEPMELSDFGIAVAPQSFTYVY